MRTGQRTTSATLSVVTLASVLAACTGPDTAPRSESARAGTFIYTESTPFPVNLFPIIGAGTSGATANILIRILPTPFRTLPDFTVGVDADLLAAEPTLAVTDTGQIVTYQISPDAVWSDGTPISAADFEFTWRLQRSADPATGGCEALVSTLGYDQIASVEGGGDGKTVSVTYATPFPDWKALFTLFPAHVLDTGDDAANCAATTTGWPIADGIPADISGGPWQLKAENIDVGGQVVTLTPNPRWYGDGPRLNRLIYQTVNTEPGVLVGALQSGEADLVSAPPQLDLVEQIQGLQPNVQNTVTFGLVFEHLDLNTQNVHLAKPEVRRAFCLALDRAEIVATTVGAIDERARVLNNRFYVNNQPEYADTAPEQYNAQDIPGSIALLESVGYTIGADGVATHPADGPLRLQMSTTLNDPLRKQTIDLAAAQVHEAGFAMETFVDPDLFEGADRPTSLESRGFGVAMYAWISSPYVSGNAELYRTGGTQNYVGVSNPDVDRLLAQLTTELDHDVAAALANEADRILWDEMATIPLYQRQVLTAWNIEFDGIVANATTAGPLWNSEEISLAG